MNTSLDPRRFRHRCINLFQIEFSLNNILINVRNHIRWLYEWHREWKSDQEGNITCIWQLIQQTVWRQPYSCWLELFTEPTWTWEQLNQVWCSTLESFLICLKINLFKFLDFLLSFIGLPKSFKHYDSQKKDILWVSFRYPGTEIIELLDTVILVIKKEIAQKLIEDALIRVKWAKTNIW